MALTKKHNHDYSGGFPLATGDRYYAQDLGRDFNYLLDQTGLLLSDYSGAVKGIVRGWYPNIVGANNDCVNITSGIGYAPYDITVPSTPFIVPPPTATETMSLIRIFSSLVSNFSLITSGATGNGIATNYLKIKFAYAGNDQRTKAKKAGTYYYNQTPSYTITCDATPVTANEICLANIVWNSVSHAITISYTNRTSPINIGDATVVISPSGGDDGIVFNNIINWLALNGGGSIKMEKGTYLISTEILWKSKINLIGQGNNTIIKRNSSTPTQLFYIDNAVIDFTFRDFYIDGNATTYSGTYAFKCLNNTSNTNSKYQNITVYDQAGTGFSYCVNITNCNVISAGKSSYTGFGNSKNLYNCSVNLSGLSKSIGAAGSVTGYSFCDYLINCIGTCSGGSIDTDGWGGYATGYNTCTRLNNCTAAASGGGSASSNSGGEGNGFLSCTDLTNCYGTGTTAGSAGPGNISGNNGTGFSSCIGLNMCTGVGNGGGPAGSGVSGNGYGFKSCKHISLCTGSGTVGTPLGYKTCFADKGTAVGINIGTATGNDVAAYGWNTGTGGA